MVLFDKPKLKLWHFIAIHSAQLIMSPIQVNHNQFYYYYYLLLLFVNWYKEDHS